MNTALNLEASPSLFNKENLSFSGGWCWEDRPYWGQVAEVSGIIPPGVQIDVPHNQKTTEFWFYFAAVSRYISYAATMNGDKEPMPGFAQVCNKLTHELMQGSIENGTPVNMLLTEYDLNHAAKQPNLSDFYVVEYKAAADPKKLLLERQWTYKWIDTYVQGQLDEKEMCERCAKHEHDIKAQFDDDEMGKDEQLLCWGCYVEMTLVEGAWSFTAWYMHTQKEQWSVNSKLTDELKDGYEAYCKGEGVKPYWDAAETTQEALEIGDFVEVTIPFTWSGDKQKIGARFVIKEQHVNQGFERWVKKVSQAS